MADKKTATMASFYSQCKANGYTDMTDATQSLKAKVIATDLKLNYKNNIASFYEAAKRCYEEVQREKEAEAAQRMEAKRQAEKEAKRRAVDGKLLLTLSDSRNQCNDEKKLHVYMRPDETVYCTLNDSKSKIEGAPQLSVNKGGTLSYTYHPSKAIYTGATVGGVTTGGVHYTQAGYSQRMDRTGTGYIEVTVDGASFTVDRVILSPFTMETFHRDATFKSKVRNGQILCKKQSSGDDLWLKAAIDTGADYQTFMTMASRAADKERLSRSECVAIVDLVGHIIHGDFPPTDEQLYEQARQLEEMAKTSVDLKKAEDAFRFISDYQDSSKRANALSKKYDVILQEEKEQTILEKEREAEKCQKTMKRFLKIYLPLTILCVAVVFVVKSIVLPSIAYDRGESLLTVGNYDGAIAVFEGLGDYKDSAELALSAKYAKAEKALEAGDYSTANASFIELAQYKDAPVRVQETHYKWAEAFLSSGDSNGAMSQFESAGNYLDASERFKELEKAKKEAETAELVAKAEAQAESGDKAGAAIAFFNIPDYKEGRARSLALWEEVAQRDTIACQKFAYGLCSDGTVVSTEYVYSLATSDYEPCVFDGNDIAAIAASEIVAVGLRSDGSVVMKREHGEFDEIYDGNDIVAIAAGSNRAFGLRANGTVIGIPDMFSEQPYSDWKDIMAIAAGDNHIVGLQTDGTVIATHGDEQFDGNKFGQCNTSAWEDIVAIAAGGDITVGIRADGTVVATGDIPQGHVTNEWTDIVAVAVGDGHIIGLRVDGTVVACGRNENHRLEVRNWTDIVAIATCEYFTIGLRADGTVISTENSDRSFEFISKWSNIRVPST